MPHNLRASTSAHYDSESVKQESHWLVFRDNEYKIFLIERLGLGRGKAGIFVEVFRLLSLMGGDHVCHTTLPPPSP